MCTIWTQLRKKQQRRNDATLKVAATFKPFWLMASGTGNARSFGMQKTALHQKSRFSVPSGFAIMTKTKRPFINPPAYATTPVVRFFNH